jgi:hypothetical protein
VLEQAAFNAFPSVLWWLRISTKLRSHENGSDGAKYKV